MSENPNPQPDPDLPLDETQAASPQASAKPASVTGVTTDVTTDFDANDSAPSSGRLGLLGTAPRTPATQQMVADYRLEHKLGEGGMGRVFKALDPQGRAVAIKLLSQHLTCSDEALQRFKQEGYIASQINHPHCVFVHRVDEDRGTPFIAMELMTGKTLKDLVQQGGGLPYKEAVRLILQCIDGLIEAHRLGMIHRDIKPANCYLDEEGNVKIGDFGLARSLVDDSELTRTGAFLGTPLFASPEQLLGQKIDERSDIYSLSATLYYLLAGRAPFESPNAAQVIAKIASSDPPPFSEANVKVPAALETIVLHGLARDRDKRFESFQKMRTALLPFMAAEREIASLPRRAIGGFLDLCIFAVLFRILTVALSSLLGISIVNLPSLMPFFATVGWLFYLWLFEWLAGWTIGKRIVKIKVVDAQLGMRQSASKLLMRAGIFVAATESIKLVHHLLYSESGELPSRVATAVSAAVGLGLMMLTWRRSQSRQLTHEWYSQTETCMAVPHRTTVTAELELPEWSLPLRDAQACPAEFGCFTIKGQLLTSQVGQWLLAHDEKLEREVWIHWLPAGAPPISAERKACTLRTRMRVIESGVELGRHWDAYMAPEGIPLSVFIQHGVHLPWPIAQNLITELTKDQEPLAGEVSSEHLWDAQRYWLNASGKLTFAEANIEAGEPAIASTPEELLQQVALAALPPKHRERSKLNTSVRPQAVSPIPDLPTYGALKMLERMATRSLSLSRLKSDLAHVNRSPDRVAPAMRFVHAVTVTLLMSPFLLALMMSLIVNMIIRFEFVLRAAQTCASVSRIQSFPDKYPMAFEGLSPAAKEAWLSSDKVIEFSHLLNQKRGELQAEFTHANAIERVALNAMGINQAFVDGDLLPEEMQTFNQTESKPKEEAPPDEEQIATELVGEINGPVAVRIGGIQNSSKNIRGLLADVESDQELRQPNRLSTQQRTTLFWILVIPLAVTTIWTGLTRGGLAQLLTGVAVVRRDGRRIGWIRAALRNLLLFAPFAMLGWSVVELEAAGIDWLWLSMQLKILVILLPIFYLTGALIWPQQGPHDRLCQTVVVPR